jgi:hypothetical protein
MILCSSQSNRVPEGGCVDETVHRMQTCVASCVLRSSVEVPVHYLT